MTGTPDHTTPFGTFALPAARERIRARADRCSDSQLGRWQISLRRKRAIKNIAEPYDVTVAPGVKARLYPSGNRCEKRALAGVQIWDLEERESLKTAIQSGDNHPFIFLDIGANAGLYSLFVNAYAQATNRERMIIAVEPSQQMAARLQFNAWASCANITLVQSAISDAPGEAYLTDGGGNRGEAQLAEDGAPVHVETVAGLCERLGLSRIDAMKLDIEGHDERALRAFFETAPESLHPRLLIVETSAESGSPLIELAKAQNYLVAETTGLNAILKKSDHVQT